MPGPICLSHFLGFTRSLEHSNNCVMAQMCALSEVLDKTPRSESILCFSSSLSHSWLLTHIPIYVTCALKHTTQLPTY